MVTIIDPHIKRESGYFLHEDALKNDLYVKDKNGKVYEGRFIFNLYFVLAAKVFILPYVSKNILIFLIKGGAGQVPRLIWTSLIRELETIGHLVLTLKITLVPL